MMATTIMSSTRVNPFLNIVFSDELGFGFGPRLGVADILFKTRAKTQRPPPRAISEIDCRKWSVIG